MRTKLNIGCGTDIRPEYINLDVAPLSGVDVIHDLETVPLPFKSSTFEEIVCQDVLEHVGYIPLLREFSRLLKPGGRLKIRVPHFSSSNNYVDPTHKNMFSSRTFDYFTRSGRDTKRNYYFDFSFGRVLSTYITFDGRRLIHRRIIEKAVNKSNSTRSIFEQTALCNIFPAENIIVEIEK